MADTLEFQYFMDLWLRTNSHAGLPERVMPGLIV